MYISRGHRFEHFHNLENIKHISGRYYVNFKIYSLGKKDVHLLLASNDLDTHSSYEIVIGSFQNTYVGIKKHKGTTKGLMSMNIPNVLLLNEPNEIHVRVDKGMHKNI